MQPESKAQVRSGRGNRETDATGKYFANNFIILKLFRQLFFFIKARDLKSIVFVFMWANFYFIHSIQVLFYVFAAELNSSMIVADYNITKAQFRHSAKIFSSYFSSNGFKYIYIYKIIESFSLSLYSMPLM